MKITHVTGREIFDSRAIPTIECTLTLEDGTHVSASVPSGTSQSRYAAHELRDGGLRLGGNGVKKAIHTLETVIAPALIGQEPNFVTMDNIMIELDGTENKSTLGANSMLAASTALCKAQALIHNVQPYELIAWICNQDTVTIPFGMFNLINGGAHSNNNCAIQEFMIIPIGAQSFRQSLEWTATITHQLKKLLKKNNYSISTGYEGGFAPQNLTDFEALELLATAVDASGLKLKKEILFALDVAATQFHNPETNTYAWHGKTVESDALIQFYTELTKMYPFYSIEDGLAETDIGGWKQMMDQIGNDVQLIGDDIFATNPHRISAHQLNEYAHGTLIKPNQIGTISETVHALSTAINHDMIAIISHRSGETTDSFLADLAVGTSAGLIKAGGCLHGERTAKYNRLLAIEDNLLNSVISSM